MKTLCVFMILVFVGTFVWGQSVGQISGKVTDIESGKSVFGAKIEVAKDGKTVGVGYADENGKFSIINIQEGKYDLIISKAKYMTKTISDVEIKASMPSIDIALEIIVPIQLGDLARDFKLPSHTGNMVSISSFKNKDVVILCINNPFG